MPLTREQTKYVPSNDTVFLPTVSVDRNLGVLGNSVFDSNATFNNGLLAYGNVNIGDSTAPAGVIQLGLMLSTDAESGRNFILRKSSTSGYGPAFTFMKSSGTNALPKTVVNGDSIGNLFWESFDGTNYTEAASILANADNTVSTGYVPGRLTFNTTSTSAVRVERMRIASDGTITASGNLVQNVNTTAKTSAYQLVVADANTVVQMNGAFNFTVDTSLAVLPLGTTITLVAQSAGVGVAATATATVPTINATPGLKLRAAWSTATLIKMSAASASGTASTWLLTGDLTA